MPIAKHKIDALNTDVTTAFLDAYKGGINQLYNEITEVIPMKTKKMEIPIRGLIGQMREWIGPRIIETISYDRFSFTITKFEKTLSILRDDVEDDNVGIYKGDALDLGIAAREWKDVQVFKKLEANDVWADGVNFFSAVHPTDVGNQSNYQTGAEPAWYIFDTSRARKPLIFGERIEPELTSQAEVTNPHTFFHDEFIWGLRARGGTAYGLWQLAYKSKQALNEANFEAALIAMSERKNDRGDKLGTKGTLLLVPGSLQGDARRLLNRATSNGTDNVYQNAIRWEIGDRLTGV
jgi:phage major head subunit gpT-like protein